MLPHRGPPLPAPTHPVILGAELNPNSSLTQVFLIIINGCRGSFFPLTETAGARKGLEMGP